MKCTRCATELPAEAEYCLKCGTRAAAAARSTARGGASPWLWVAVAALGAAAGGFLLWRALSGRPTGKVVQASATTPRLGPLTERTGRIGPVGPLASKQGSVASEPLPTDIIDYLKFLKEIERERVLLTKGQIAEVLKQSADLTYAGAGDWTTNEPEQRATQIYQRFQQSLSQWTTQWQQLSAKFLQKPAPQACTELRDRYYDLLGKTGGAMARVGNSFSEAMSGNAAAALESLTKMQGSGLGSASKDVGDACSAADESLGAVCTKYRLHKDFDIRDDLGGANLLGR